MGKGRINITKNGEFHFSFVAHFDNENGHRNTKKKKQMLAVG